MRGGDRKKEESSVLLAMHIVVVDTSTMLILGIGEPESLIPFPVNAPGRLNQFNESFACRLPLAVSHHPRQLSRCEIMAILMRAFEARAPCEHPERFEGSRFDRENYIGRGSIDAMCRKLIIDTPQSRLDLRC
jgi:hypothetical protein